MPEDLTKRLFGNSLFIQGNDEEKWRNTPEELRQAIVGYFQGKGISIKILKKYYGYGGSLRITPSEAELRAARGQQPELLFSS